MYLRGSSVIDRSDGLGGYEVRTDLINRTECIKGNGKGMTVAGDLSLLIFRAFGHRFSC